MKPEILVTGTGEDRFLATYAKGKTIGYRSQDATEIGYRPGVQLFYFFIDQRQISWFPLIHLLHRTYLASVTTLRSGTRCIGGGGRKRTSPEPTSTTQIIRFPFVIMTPTELRTIGNYLIQTTVDRN